MGAADRRGPAARQDAAKGVAADDFGDLLAAPERREVAQYPGRIGSVVAGCAALYSLGEAGRLGAPARSRPAARHRASTTVEFTRIRAISLGSVLDRSERA